MSDTSKPLEMPRPWSAPLNRPLAETVSLELVWAAAYAFRYSQSTTYWSRAEDAGREAVEYANGAVAALLAAHPRGGR